jgi:hypothetical protein
VKTLTALLGLLVITAGSARAATVAGGGSAKSDCYTVFDVGGATAPSANMATCDDGNPACDADGTVNDACSFSVALCANSPAQAPTCTAPGVLTSITPKAAASSLPLPPLDQAACGEPGTINVPLKLKRGGQVKKPGKVKLKAITVASVKPKKDKDKVTLVCNPPGVGTGPLAGPPCPASSVGPDAPNELITTVKPDGTDLDNGWKGATHNFPYVSGTQVQLCLDGCDATTNPICNATLPFGEGTFNGTQLGAPIPIFTAGVPVCVVVKIRPEQAGEVGHLNLETGAFDTLTFRLAAEVYLTEEEKVCPRCNAGRCDSGPNQGDPCTIDGVITVSESTATNKTFNLSEECLPPTTAPAGTLILNIPLTTGTSTLQPLPGGTAATPCVAQPGEPGLSPAPDSCGSGTCNAQCTGKACARQIPDPITGQPTCVDAKGGLSQLCCSNTPDKPCYPTKAGNPIGVIERTGKAVPGVPPWPEPTYPKTSESVIVGTFCEPATGTGSVDGLTGLPGPGSLVLPQTAVVYTPSTRP